VSAGANSPLSIARGAVREGLAALFGFSQLIGSRRVGPRALERARADMDDACASLAAALDALERGLVEVFGPDENAASAARALCAYVTSHVKTLAGALSADGSLENARRRLALEAAIRTHGDAIQGAMSLCDLLVAATTPSPVELDVADALEHRFGSRTDETSSVRLFIDAPTPTTMHVDRHVLVGLVELGATLAARGNAAQVRLGLRSIGGSPVLRIAPVPRGAALPKTSLLVPRAADLPFTIEVARATGQRAGLRVELDPGTNAVTIKSEVPPGPC